MNVHDQETLRRIEQNDDTMKKLWIGDSRYCLDDSGTGGAFNSRVGNDYSRLGASIGENTHLTTLTVVLGETHGYSDHEITLDITNSEFFDGLKSNSSIHELVVDCSQQRIVGGIIQEILEAYQANNKLTSLLIVYACLQNGGDHVIATTLQSCTNLKDSAL